MCVLKTFIPWICAEIKEEIRLEHMYHKKAQTHNLNIYWDLYNNFRNSVANMIKQARKSYYVNLILDKTNYPRLMWKCLSDFLPGKTKSSSKCLTKDGVIETNKKKIVNMLNTTLYNF